MLSLTCFRGRGKHNLGQKMAAYYFDLRIKIHMGKKVRVRDVPNGYKVKANLFKQICKNDLTCLRACVIL